MKKISTDSCFNMRRKRRTTIVKNIKNGHNLENYLLHCTQSDCTPIIDP